SRIEILDDVVEIGLPGFLIKRNVGAGHSPAESGLSVLCEDLELARAGWLGKEITCERIGSFVRGVMRAISSQPVVVGELAFERAHAAVRKFPLHQRVCAGRFVGGLPRHGLRLDARANREKFLPAIVRSVQVIAALRVPEVVLNASRTDHILMTGRGTTV